MNRDVGQLDFSSLIRAAKRKNRTALGEIHRRYAPLVLRRLRLGLGPLLRRRYDTLDLGQSVFVEVLRDLDRFEDRGEPAFLSWLVLKSKNKVRMKLRKVGRGGRGNESVLESPDLVLAKETTDPYQAAQRSDETEQLDRILDSLGEVDRTVVTLRGRQELPFAAVAELAGLPTPDAARRRYARILLRLRQRWMNAR